MTVKASLYFHINNGGVTLSVEDKGTGPIVSMRANHFGHQTGRTSVGVRKADLRAVGDMFHRAAGLAFSPDYAVAADAPRDELGQRAGAPGNRARTSDAAATHDGTLVSFESLNPDGSVYVSCDALTREKSDYLTVGDGGAVRVGRVDLANVEDVNVLRWVVGALGRMLLTGQRSPVPEP